jgi:uncharacterized protein (DUF1778 family)
MTSRSQQLQIRVTPQEKSALRRHARAAGQDLSAYVLALAFPNAAKPFADLLEAIGDESTRRFALAALNDALSALAPIEFSAAVESIDVRTLDPLWQNYVAAMVEQAARALGTRTPEWTQSVVPLDRPYFATTLRSIRSYLLRDSPVVFKRRNLFVDASVGARV